jgi:PAS domain S-box-containing protein
MNLISTIKASCRDCYKCVRHCPVKAIRVNDNHAEVVAERCIGDGRCVTICPQSAKKVVSQVELVKSFLRSGVKIAASLAPSFVAAFKIEPGRLVAALQRLGFHYVEETIEGAELVARAHGELISRQADPVITSCCPAVVNLIEIYYPKLMPYLAAVVSPMTAHGKIMKTRYGEDCKVVFIGPCITKKGEAGEVASIDAVLTFQELEELFGEAGLDPAALEIKEFDGLGAKRSHAFPSPGGLARAALLSTDLLAKEIISIDGLEETIQFLDNFLTVKGNYRLIELLACRGGCINGPGMTNCGGIYQRREELLSYAQQHQKQNSDGGEARQSIQPDLSRIYRNRSIEEAEPSEAEIKTILSRTGKYQPQDELNCGACGYNSCREKAVAVARGLAEVDMCIPFMRAKAESRGSLIFQMSPNAIIVVDREMIILEANPVAERIFMLNREQIPGMKLSGIIDPVYFREAMTTRRVVAGEVAYPAYNLVAWQALVYLEQEEVLIGIFSDITKEKQQREKLDLMTDETLEKAQEVINKQMRVAQEIAGLLGETTAETKVLLTKLMSLIQNETGKGR